MLIEIQTFYLKEYVWKYRLRNVAHFVSASNLLVAILYTRAWFRADKINVIICQMHTAVAKLGWIPEHDVLTYNFSWQYISQFCHK